ncbi:MAG TPA: helix-turn-helix domain-containing protein [Ramlibacter sp.]|uniref:helix-turn-helix domain-containing protein n=1 Tax=Ramlibacter sp. TaxID=1917967 RepID=UPI002ED52797
MKDMFDADSFYAAIDRTLRERQVNWKQVSTATGVSPTTLTRMSQGRRPDAASLAALSAWAGINPADYVAGVSPPSDGPSTLEKVSAIFRQDPCLDEDARHKLESILESAYLALRSPE